MPATIVRWSVPVSTMQLQQLVRLRHAFGREHLRDAQLDLHEVVDRRCARRLGASAAAARCRGCGAGAGAAGCGGAGCRLALRRIVGVVGHLSQFLHCVFDARKERLRSRRALCPAPAARVRRVVHDACCGVDAEHRRACVRRVRHERPQQLGDDAQRVGGDVERRARARRGVGASFASFHGSRVTM